MKIPLTEDQVQFLDQEVFNYNQDLLITYDRYSKLHIRIRVSTQSGYDIGITKAPSTFELFTDSYSSIYKPLSLHLKGRAYEDSTY